MLKAARSLDLSRLLCVINSKRPSKGNTTLPKTTSMKQFILILSLLFPLLSWAQDKDNALSIITGISIANQLTGEEYHRLKNRNTQDFIPKVDRTLLISANYRFGIDYQRRIIKGFHAKIGARFANWSEKYTHNQTLIHQIDVHYLETPISLQYKFSNKTVQPYLEVGGSPMFYLQSNEPVYSYSPEPIKIHLALHAGAGLSYQISDHFSIFGQISSRFRVTSNEYDITPFEIGLELGGAFYF